MNWIKIDSSIFKNVYESIFEKFKEFISRWIVFMNCVIIENWFLLGIDFGGVFF